MKSEQTERAAKRLADDEAARLALWQQTYEQGQAAIAAAGDVARREARELSEKFEQAGRAQEK